jgi:hypothetical protein
MVLQWSRCNARWDRDAKLFSASTVNCPSLRIDFRQSCTALLDTAVTSFAYLGSRGHFHWLRWMPVCLSASAASAACLDCLGRLDCLILFVAFVTKAACPPWTLRTSLLFACLLWPPRLPDCLDHLNRLGCLLWPPHEPLMLAGFGRLRRLVCPSSLGCLPRTPGLPSLAA